MEKKRSIGITIFAILILLISGFVFTMFSVILIPEVQNQIKTLTIQQLKEFPIYLSPYELEQAADASKRVGRNIAIRTIIYSILIFISGIAILLRYNWGRLLFFTVILVGFISNIIGFVFGGTAVDKELIPTIVVYLLAIFISLFYLTRPKIKERFR